MRRATILLLSLFALAFTGATLIRGSKTAPSAAALAVAQVGDPIFEGDCYPGSSFDLLEGGFAHVTCFGPPLEPTPTLAPTNTPQVTRTPTPTPVITSTVTAEPTATSTPMPPVVEHDTNECHSADTGFGHTHGLCPSEIPAGMVRDFVVANAEFGDIDHPWPSSSTENLWPWPVGKHEGFKGLFFGPFGSCLQFNAQNNPPEPPCLRSVFIQIHSIGTAEAERTANSVHSFLFVAEVCNDLALTDCRIVAGAQPSSYGEVHSQYKTSGCEGIPDGVYFPAPYSVNDGDPASAQVPYIATHADRNFFSRPARQFWNSQINQVLVPTLGDINTLVESAWTENAFEVTAGVSVIYDDSGNPIAYPCADPDQDRIWATSTNAGFINQYVLWTFRIELAGRPEGWSFTDRVGDPAPGCTEPAFDCILFYREPGITDAEVFFNTEVRNANFDVTDPAQLVDITEPNVYMPGFAP